jgi:UDP-N-acetylglucosamine 2-epimerase
MPTSIILGTGPGMIKEVPTMRELERRKSSYFILHTG